MKQNLTTFFYLLIFQSVFGQLNYNELLPMQSRGPMPEKLKKSYYFAQYENSQTPYLTIGKTTAIERQMIYESIIRSGLPVYGEESNAFCNEILQKITTLQGKPAGSYFIYPIKSDFVGTFNDEKSTIYISTHLIARMKHIEELYFHIARQVYLLKVSSKPIRSKLNRIFNYKKRFELLATYPDSTNRNADNFAIGVLNQMRLSIHGAQDGLKNLLDPNIVPEDFPITTADFCYNFKVSENLINPSTYRYDKQEKMYVQGTQEYNINKRLLEVQKLEISGNEVNNSEEENSFQEIKNLCIMQSIEDLLIANNPEKALYYCLVMKKKGVQTGYLAVMEALCWETLILRETKETFKQLQIKNELQNTAPGAFFLGMFRLYPNDVRAMGLLNMYRLKKMYPAEAETIAQIINFSIGSIDQTMYSDKPTNMQLFFQQIRKNQTPEAFPKETELFIALKNELLADTSFKNDVLAAENKKALTPKDIHVIHPQVLAFHKQSYNIKKSIAKTNQLYTILKESEDVKLIAYRDTLSNDLSITQTYNEINYFLRIHQQLNNQTKHKAMNIPVNIRELNRMANNIGTPVISNFSLENQYNLNPQGYHLLSFFLVPFPVMGFDWVLGGNHSKCFVYIYDQKLGKLVHAESSKYRDPLKYIFIKNKLFYTYHNL